MLSIVATETSAPHVPAIPLAIITHWSLALGILAIGIVTCVYTWIGGLRAVVWVDVIQLGVYLLGGIATLIVATGLAGGWHAFGAAWDAGKLAVFDFRLSFAVLYTFWGGVIGGALLAAASHGTDHLIVQRLLAARGLRDARKALIGSGAFIIGQFALFLLVGTALWLAGADHVGMRSDAIYPTFVVTQLPRSEEHTSELQSPCNLVCRLLLEKKKDEAHH